MSEETRDIQPIEIKNYIVGEEEINAVDARDVYKFVENKRQFTDWIKQRLKDTQAEENYDYFTISLKSEIANTGGYKTNITYILTLDLAKEFAMLEKNQKGKEIRRYFITFEKKIKEKIKLFDERLDEQRKWTRQLQRELDNLSKQFRAMKIKDEYEALKKDGYII